MSEVLFCPNCGSRQAAQARFCFACGQDLMSSVPAGTVEPDQPAAPPPPPVAPSPAPVAPPVAPVAPPVAAAAPNLPPAPVAPPAWSIPKDEPQFLPAGAYGVPAAGGHFAVKPGVGATRPTGIAVLAILEIAGGVLGLWAAKVLFDVADFRNYWYADGGSYQFLGLASAAGAIAAFVLAWGLWSVRPWAWMLGCALCIVTAAFAVLGLFGGGNAASEVISIGVSAAILYYLNTNGVRALFGRPPTTFMQLQSPH